MAFVFCLFFIELFLNILESAPSSFCSAVSLWSFSISQKSPLCRSSPDNSPACTKWNPYKLHWYKVFFEFGYGLENAVIEPLVSDQWWLVNVGVRIKQSSSTHLIQIIKQEQRIWRSATGTATCSLRSLTFALYWSLF